MSALAGVLCLCFFANASSASPSLWRAADANSDEHLSALDLIASYFAICPLQPTAGQGQGLEKLQESLLDQARFRLKTFGPLLAGKSIELCFLEGVPWLSKAGAKGFGKTAKAFQSGKSGFALLSAGISGYGSVKLAERISSSGIHPLYLTGFTLFAMTLEQVSSPQTVEALKGSEANDYYIAFDHWIGRPFFHRTISTGARYALEKYIQQILHRHLIPAGVSTFLLAQSSISRNSADVLGKGSAIGFSKVATGALAAHWISATEIAVDALSAEPELDSEMRKWKYIQDVAAAIGTNLIFSVALPSTLLAGTPRKIALFFLVGNCLYIFFFY